MKNVVVLAVPVLALTLIIAAFSCGGNGTPPPNATKTPTAIISPTATAIPPTETPVPQPIPELIPPFPKVMGMVQLGDMADPLDTNTYNFQSNAETANQLLANGFQAIQIWPHERVMSQDVGLVICNPGIKVIAIRPLARVSMDSGTCIEGTQNPTWENADFGQIAYDLLEQYGDLSCRGGEPLDIILNNWEIDWQYKGPFCREATPTPYRYQKVTEMLKTRQMGVEWARSVFPDALLRVLHGIVVNHHEATYAFSFSRDVLPGLIADGYGPHVIGISFYTKQWTFTQVVEVLKLRTGYPVSRMYVAEHGENEKWPGRQRGRFEQTLPRMDAAGIRVVFMWTWKQFWPGSIAEDGSRTGGWHGLWEVDENLGLPIQRSFTGRWTSGLRFVQEFRMRFDEPPLPAITPPVGNTPVPSPTPPGGGATPTPTPTSVPPTETPKPPPTGTPMPPTPTFVPPTETPVDTPTPPVATETPIPPPVYTFTPTPDPCADCPIPGTIWCDMYPEVCAQCWEDCGQPMSTPTPGPPTNTPTKTPTPGAPTPTPTSVPEDCDGCPLPGTLWCEMAPDACYQCWEDCGEPLPTRTPTPIPTITPTPTPPWSNNPTFSVYPDATPTHCVWVFTHDESGTVISEEVALCADMNQTFGLEGWWTIEIMTHYNHGAVGIQTEPNGDKHGDLDGDGMYEYWHSQPLEVLPKPAVPIFI